MSDSKSSAASSSSAPAPIDRLPEKWRPDPSAITLYWDPRSQPSRSVAQLIYEGDLPHRMISISLKNKEQKLPLYTEIINPAGLVPVIYKPESKQFMAESADILKYISNQYSDKVGDFYANHSEETKTTINETLQWNADIIRPVLTGLTRAQLVQRNPTEVANLRPRVPDVIAQMEARLKENQSRKTGGGDGGIVYFCGTPKPSIADIQIWHEINGPIDYGAVILSPSSHPLLREWTNVMALRPAGKKAYGNFGWIMWTAKKLLETKACFGSKTGTL